MAVETLAVGLEDLRPQVPLRFRDNASGCEVVVATPGTAPELWRQYLAGALRVYRHFDIEAALEYDRTVDGRSTTLFFAALDDSGTVVGGLRIQGPYVWTSEIGSLAAWEGRPGHGELRTMMARRIPRGVVEARGAWVARDCSRRADVAAAVSRCIAHAPRLLGVRYGFATVSVTTVERHRASGAVVAAAIPPVPYPDERYRTVPLWWDTRTYRMFADRLQYLLICGELRLMGIADPGPVSSHRWAGRREKGRRAYGR